MISFNNMKEFLKDEEELIKKSSPILHQQSIIPKLELERLKNEFKNFDNYDLKPNFYNINELDLADYCLEYGGKNFMLFKQKNKYICKN